MSEDLMEFIKNEYIPKSTLRYIAKIKEKDLQELKELFQIGDFQDKKIEASIEIKQNEISLINAILKC